MNAPCDWCEQDDVPTGHYITELNDDVYLCPECFTVLETDGALDP